MTESVLTDAWEAYEQSYIQADGRVIDPGAGGITTSEGQAYALVRALWVDDRDTFGNVLEWTTNNLQGGDPARLPAWKWGRRDDDSWGVLDAMPASDADEWIAWALLGAAERWGRPRYRDRALGLLERIWEEETLVVGGRRVLLPGPWAHETTPLRLNPSYWLTFTWRSFALADPGRPWDELIAPAYALLAECRGASGLPPEWCSVDRETGRVVPPLDPRDTNFGFEAFRVAWTLAAEWRWHEEPRARALMAPFSGLHRRWRRDGYIPALIASDGSAVVTWDYPGLYGALLPAWSAPRARALYEKEILPIRATHGWADRTDYYGQNWIWLGMALWSGLAAP